MDNSKRFVQVREPVIVKIREHVLRLAHLNRCQSPIVNRLRQDLAWQFPEIAKVKFNKQGSRLSLALRWLAGEVKSAQYEKLLEKSIGLEIKPTL